MQRLGVLNLTNQFNFVVQPYMVVINMVDADQPCSAEESTEKRLKLLYLQLSTLQLQDMSLEEQEILGKENGVAEKCNKAPQEL